MNNLLNNKGITLVELLAALALVGIIATVAGSLVTQTYQSNSKVQNEIDLKQQTNSILTIIREQITEENMEICLVDRHTLRLDDDGEAPYLYPNLMTKEQMTISELYIENLDKSSTTDDTVSIEPNTATTGDNCIITDKHPTSIKMTSIIEGDTNLNDQTYTTSTIISKRGESTEVALPIGEDPADSDDSGNDENNGNSGGNEIFLTSDEFKKIEDYKMEDRTEGFVNDSPNPNKNKCEFNENIRLNSNTAFDPTNGESCLVSTFNKSLWSVYPFTIRSPSSSTTKVIVKNHLYMDNTSTLEHDSVLEVDKNATFKKPVTLNSKSRLLFQNGHFQEGITMERNSKVSSNGSIRLDAPSILKSTSTMDINGYAFTDKLTIQETASLTVQNDMNVSNSLILIGTGHLSIVGDLSTQNHLEMQSNASIETGDSVIIGGNTDLGYKNSMNIGGNLHMKGDLSIPNQSTISAGGDIVIDGNTAMQSDSIIYSEGNITFNGSVSTQSNNIISSKGSITFNDSVGPDWSKVTICANGPIYGENNIDIKHKVKSNQKDGKCPTP